MLLVPLIPLTKDLKVCVAKLLSDTSPLFFREFDEADEFCPHCDNHFVIEAVTPEGGGGFSGIFWEGAWACLDLAFEGSLLNRYTI